MWELDAIVCKQEERPFLRRLFGEEVRLLGVGEAVAGAAFRTVIATQAALADMRLRPELSAEWIESGLQVRTSLRGSISPAFEEFLSNQQKVESDEQ